MKRSRIVTIIAAVMAAFAAMTAGCSHSDGDKDSLNNLYRQVDEEIAKSQIYMAEKEHRINNLKRELRNTTEPRGKLGITYSIVNEYEAYISDSALNYVSEAENIAAMLGDRYEMAKSRIKKADIESHAALFAEAHETLDGLTRSDLDSTLTAKLYAVYCALYQYETEYLPEGEYSLRSAKLRDLYTDSLMSISSPESFDYLSNWAVRQINESRQAAALKELEKNLGQYRSGDRQYSIIASIIANVYHSVGDWENHKRYLAMTVISDIRGAVKENMAMRELATQVFEDGDIDRANHYVKVSLDDANFYAGRVRNAQSSRILPVIDKAYDLRQQKLQKRLRGYLYALCALLAVFIAAVYYIVKQWRSVEEANRMVKKSNDELQEMSEQLREMNGALENSNNALEHSNNALEHTNNALEHTNEEMKKSVRITEEYAGLFMEYSSLNISNLEKYHTVLRNLAIQGNVKGLLKKLDSDDVVNETLKVFYSKFDEAVLNIYPSFVEKVNALLREESKVVLKPGEKLNTELRVLALMRIGIYDPEKIAQFLRCSVSTIYTYRSKMKRRAIDPKSFESDVMEI